MECFTLKRCHAIIILSVTMTFLCSNTTLKKYNSINLFNFYSLSLRNYNLSTIDKTNMGYNFSYYY